MTPDEVARIVDRRDEPAFGALLREADAEFVNHAFEPALADVLRADADLTDRWVLWSADQRWTPSAYVHGAETGWYDEGRRHVRTHTDQGAAVADFIHRMAGWRARGEVLSVEE